MQDLLIETVFPLLGDELLQAAEDSAVMEVPAEGRIALTTDSFVVKPLFFPGGDIGKLAVCGTVNDLTMVGATPSYLTLGLIIEEGLPLDILKKALESLGRWSRTSGVRIVSGDTKVVERGAADGIYINTAGVGIMTGNPVSISNAREGDALVINGYIGDHGIAVLGKREGFSFQTEVESDCAPLNRLAEAMLAAGTVHSLRDPTRGGLAAALNEMASASGHDFLIDEAALPVREEVDAVCEMLGLDPCYVANEGKLLAAVPQADLPAVMESMRADPLGMDSAVIGSVQGAGRGKVSLTTALGTTRLLRMPSGEQLPRIC